MQRAALNTLEATGDRCGVVDGRDGAVLCVRDEELEDLLGKATRAARCAVRTTSSSDSARSRASTSSWRKVNCRRMRLFVVWRSVSLSATR